MVLCTFLAGDRTSTPVEMGNVYFGRCTDVEMGFTPEGEFEEVKLWEFRLEEGDDEEVEDLGFERDELFG